MTTRPATPPSSPPGSGNSAGTSTVRAYLLDMIEQLADMAERSGEAAMAIHLIAIRDAARAAERQIG